MSCHCRPADGRALDRFAATIMRQAQRHLLNTARGAQRLGRPRHRILVACFPKSGSTWLRTILTGLPGFRTAWITESSGRAEQELSAGRIASAGFHDFVAQHHVRFNERTTALIEAYDLKPVVLVRDIFDSVVSLADHLRMRWPELPQALVSADVLALPDERLHDFLIDMAVPWYIDFHVSWAAAPHVPTVRYEDLRADPVATVSHLVRRLGIRVGNDAVERAVAAAQDAPVLFNRGITGRGACLTPAQRSRILRQAAYYPSVDFSPIGLPAPPLSPPLSPALSPALRPASITSPSLESPRSETVGRYNSIQFGGPATNSCDLSAVQWPSSTTNAKRGVSAL